ncbi:flagellar motor protein MotB [Nocardioides sp. SR21]|uniref:OmpA/MotB family protein n=1 Tax=Nocardioides sp. SR21 TaxID=2919501 RepID=UPI001FA970A9|nr:flagellar motor protein MotB [Nocardioides sp. SR21]
MSAPRSRRRRQEDHEEHENHERWLVTYADMLTLLMVLFIVMFAMSQVDQTKYEALRDSLSVGFGAESNVLQGSKSILDDNDAAVEPDLVTGSLIDSLDTPPGNPVTSDAETERQRQLAAARAEASNLKAVEVKLLGALKAKGLQDDVRTIIDERGLVVSLVSRHVVFQPDIASLSARGQQVVDTLAPVLADIPNALRLDGHTNQEPVRPRLYATDWDLSAARAVTVLRRLNELHGIPQSRLSASAFGHTEPLIDPSLPASQDINKRVDIVVLPGTDAMSSQLIDDVINARSGANQGVEG